MCGGNPVRAVIERLGVSPLARTDPNAEEALQPTCHGVPLGPTASEILEIRRRRGTAGSAQLFWDSSRVLLTIAAGLVVAASWRPLAAPEATAGPVSCAPVPTAGCVFDRSISVAAAIRDPYDRAAAFARIAEAQGLAGRAQAARANFSRALSSAMAIGGDRDIARPLTKRFDDEVPHLRADILTQIANAHWAMGQSGRARETLALALDAAGSIRSDYWRAHRFILIAQVQAEVGALAEARASISRAIADGAAPFAHSLREAAAAQAGAGDFESALATAQAIGSDTLRNWSMADIVQMQAGAGDDDGALVTVQRIEKPYFRMLAMHHIAAARAEAEDIDGAMRAAEGILEIFNGALGQFLARDAEILYSDSLKAIADAHLAAGAYGQALSLAAQMPDPLPVVTTHAAVAMAKISEGDLDTARITAGGICEGRHLRYGDDCVEVLASLASAYAAKGDPEAAAETVRTATRIADRIIYFPDRARAFTAIWKTRNRIGDAPAARRQAFEAALAAAGDSDDTEAGIDELIVLASVAAPIGEREDATRAFSAAWTLAGRFEDLEARASALVKIAAALARAGETERARQGFSEARQSAAHIKEPYRRAAVLVEIASALAAHGQ